MGIPKEFLGGDFLSSVVWAVLFAILAYNYHSLILSALTALTERLKDSGTISIFGLELKGVPHIGPVSTPPDAFGQFSSSSADVSDQRAREEEYLRSKHVAFVHQVDKRNDREGYSTVILKLVGHIRRPSSTGPVSWLGKINDVKSVTYYLGNRFGATEGLRFGKKYKCENGTNSFAVRVDAFGPFLARADIEFHTGETSTAWRYVDIDRPH